MSLLRSIARSALTRVARRVAGDELFEKPGERDVTEPLAPPRPMQPPRGFSEKLGGHALCRPADPNAILASLSGTVVVHHWATWCEPCKDELPLVQALSESLGDRARVVGVSWDAFQDDRPTQELAQHVGAYAAGLGLTWQTQLVTGPPDALFSTLGLDFQRIPQTRVLDAQGKVLLQVDGAMDAGKIAEIQDLLG
jgi:thiol-disulfide isomerase/thioredoxin